jgi:epoxyqueuosine reductase
MAKGIAKYIVGDVPRFDQKNEMFKRTRWQPEWKYLARELTGMAPPADKPGYTQIDRALENAGWYVELAHARGTWMGNWGMYSWESDPLGRNHIMPPQCKITVDDPAEMSRIIKKVTKFAGADIVGICRFEQRWLYSHSFNTITREHKPLELPSQFEYAIVFGVEMDYDTIKASPTCLAGAGTGNGYSKMAFTAATLAEFIRNLGYKALPTGTDTALTMPLAIEAGLGEMGRHGILITPKFGPRLRIAKVLTDLPLQVDSPIEFGVLPFCEKCKKCARYCPGQAIQYGERTDQPLNMSTNTGVLKWPVNAEKCLAAWGKTGSNCAVCIRVCPFNKLPGPLHDMARWGIQHTPWLDPLFIRADDLLGYHKQLSPQEFWSK